MGDENRLGNSQCKHGYYYMRHKNRYSCPKCHRRVIERPRAYTDRHEERDHKQFLKDDAVARERTLELEEMARKRAF